MRVPVVVLIAMVSAGPAAAQSHVCDPLDTIASCKPRIAERLRDDGGKTVTAAQADTKKKTETGLADLPTGLSSSVKDFLPLLQMSGLLGPVTRNDDTGLVTVGLNAPDRIQLQALIETKPALFDPIKSALPVNGRDAIQKDLLAAPNRSNVTLQLSYNMPGRRLGRDFKKYQSLLDDLLSAVIDAKSKTSQGEEAVVRANVALDALLRTNGTQDVLENTTRMIEIPDGDGASELRRFAIERALVDLESAVLGLGTAFAQEVKTSGLIAFGQLVNNQPQLFFSAARTFRDPLFGPRRETYRVTYESGLGNNINALLDEAGGKCNTQASDECARAYKKFTSDPATKAAIKAGSRVSVYAEVTLNDKYAYRNDIQHIDLAFGKSSRVSLGGDYGRLLDVQDDGTAGARIDAAFRVEWSSDRTLAPDNRYLASLTLTKKLGDVSVPFGIAYANKSEFLGGFEHGVSAHVGLKFSLFPAFK